MNLTYTVTSCVPGVASFIGKAGRALWTKPYRRLRFVPANINGLGEDIEMKLGEVARHVVAFLLDHTEQEFTANTLLMHLGLPLREKRRLYDVIEVLASAGLVDVRKEARKRYFHWKPQVPIIQNEPIEIDLPADPIFQEAGTVLQVMVQFAPTAFQELSNDGALKMLERDIKRVLWGANAVSVVRVTLKNERGRILKEASASGALPAAVY